MIVFCREGTLHTCKVALALQEMFFGVLVQDIGCIRLFAAVAAVMCDIL